MSELSFLIDLIVNEKLSKAVKGRILERIKIVEQCMASNSAMVRPAIIPAQIPAHLVGQSPSTIANFMKNPPPPTPASHEATPIPPAQISPDSVREPATVVASPAAANALMHRQQAIAQAVSGKGEAGRTSPRKF